MQRKYLPPMSGGSGDHPDFDVVCIDADKVFDFCFQEEKFERTFPNIDIPQDRRVQVECEIDEENIVCREVRRRKEVDAKKGKFLICLAIEVPVKLLVVEEKEPQKVILRLERQVTFLKQVVLCAPKGTRIQCQVTGVCCCFFERETKEIQCVFDFCVVVQSKASVKLLVPSLGMCLPAECESVPMGCPPRLPKPCFKDFGRRIKRRRRKDHDLDCDCDDDSGWDHHPDTHDCDDDDASHKFPRDFVKRRVRRRRKDCDSDCSD